MTDLLRVPKLHVTNKSKIADFVEVNCLTKRDRNISMQDLSRLLHREYTERDETVERNVTEVFQELSDRVRHCGPDDGRYPFEVQQGGRLLSLRTRISKDRLRRYLYLLFCTRMNMQTARTQGGHDASVLFEQMCCEVGQRFLGGPKDTVQSFLFGTGREAATKRDHQNVHRGRFRSAVNQLCSVLNEGIGFTEESSDPVRARDGKLDVVFWKRFADNRAGQLIGFAQCKTGIHWRDDLTKLQPEGFCGKWMRQRPGVFPVRFYFVTERVVADWFNTSVDGGIMFDRCRIVQFADDLSDNLQDQINLWVTAAAKSQGLRLP